MPRTSIIQLLEIAMSLHRYLKPLNKLPTPEQTGLSARITAEANKALEETLASQPRGLPSQWSETQTVRGANVLR